LNRGYLADPRKIVQEFDQFVGRREVLPDDIGWAYRRNPDILSSFVLEVPQFQARDLFYLVMRPSDSGPRPGFILKDIDLGVKENAFLKDIARASTGDYTTFSEVVVASQGDILSVWHQSSPCQ
jgi:hypothetical protein